MLLYLNEATFVGEEGEVLAAEVRSALPHRRPLLNTPGLHRLQRGRPHRREESSQPALPTA